MNFIQKFLLYCSGSSMAVLQRTPTEINKHFGIGGVILFTAILASLSSGYALYTAFDSVWFAIGFGLLWGLMILNLDRFIVSSMRKTGGFFRQLFIASPRLLLAAFLGIIISKPLELKIFEKEIDKQLNLIINRNKQVMQDSIQLRYSGLGGDFELERQAIFAKQDSLKSEYDQASLELEKEIIGTASSTTSGKEGFGPNAKRKTQIKAEKLAALNEYKQLAQERLSYLQAKKDSLNKNEERDRAAANIVEDGYDGFAARLEALDELGKNSAIMAMASLFIMGLFIALEISPVLVKLISPRGPYDELLSRHEHGVKEMVRYQKHGMTSQADENIQTEDLQRNHRIRKLQEVLE